VIWDSPALQITGIGFFLATTIVGSTLLGRWLDGRFDTDPVLTLAMLGVGLVAGFYGAFTQMRDVLRALERNRASERSRADAASGTTAGRRQQRRTRDPNDSADDPPRW